MKLYQRTCNDTAPMGQPDPFIFFHQGIYYIYATHVNGVQLYCSRELTGGWQYKGLCFAMEHEKNYWAPALLEYEGRFYLYVSTAPAGVTDMHQQSLKVAVAPSPAGPFQAVRELLPPFSIDAHAVLHKGGLYLFYSVNDEYSSRPGTYIVVDRMISPLQMEGRPVCVVKPTLDEEIFCRDRFQKGSHWHTIEGAFYFRCGSTHFLTYSGSAYGKPSYFIGYSVAHGDCGDLRQLSWHKYPDDHTYRPLLASDASVEGTGHNSILERDGEYWIVYHGRDRGAPPQQEDSRIMRADRLLISGDRLCVCRDEGPLCGQRPHPGANFVKNGGSSPCQSS